MDNAPDVGADEGVGGDIGDGAAPSLVGAQAAAEAGDEGVAWARRGAGGDGGGGIGVGEAEGCVVGDGAGAGGDGGGAQAASSTMA